MGQSASSEPEGEADSLELTQEQVDYLKGRTHFSGHELRDWHERFIQDYPSGKINKGEFIDMYCKMLGGADSGDSEAFAEYVFRAYDRDGNQTIDFAEFMFTISTTTRGDAREKLKWSFSMYDVNNDGILSRKEVVEILLAIYRMRGMAVENMTNVAEETAFKIFVAIDKDRDDMLSQDEFVEGIEKCEGIQDLFGVPDDS